MGRKTILATLAIGIAATVITTLVISGFTGMDRRDVGEAILALIAIPIIGISWVRWRRETNRRVDRILHD